MGLFKKKKDNHDDFLNSLPSAMEEEQEKPSFPEEKKGMPSYGSELSSIKKEVSKPTPAMKMNNPAETTLIPERPKMMEHKAPMMGSSPVGHHAPGKPVFVKIDNYKEALEAIESIRGLSNQAEEILEQLARIRDDEDRELSKWHSDIQRIKDRLLIVDKNLFEQ